MKLTTRLLPKLLSYYQNNNLQQIRGNGGGGIRNPKEVVTDSEQVTDKTSTEPLQNSATDTFTECQSEQHQTDSQQDCDSNLQQKCAKSVHPLPDDLETVVKAWPELPGHIKAAIKALIQTQNKP